MIKKFIESIKQMNVYKRVYLYMNSKQRTDTEYSKGNIRQESY